MLRTSRKATPSRNLENVGVFGELVLAAGGRLFRPTDAIDPNETDNKAAAAGGNADEATGANACPGQRAAA
jgi:predicted extracellular nuclease